jgi:hypothetical protein
MPISRRSFAATLPMLVVLALPLHAADVPPADGHGTMTPADGREAVFFPPDMRSHQLRNMRDHLETVDGIVRALASADYRGAAKLAIDHLGLDSPSAAACKPRSPEAPAPAKGSMDEMMDQYMPAQMRAIGLGMHTAASDFAAVAQEAARTGDGKTALEALGKVTQYCVACHGTYRLQ